MGSGLFLVGRVGRPLTSGCRAYVCRVVPLKSCTHPPGGGGAGTLRPVSQNNSPAPGCFEAKRREAKRREAKPLPATARADAHAAGAPTKLDRRRCPRPRDGAHETNQGAASPQASSGRAGLPMV